MRIAFRSNHTSLHPKENQMQPSVAKGALAVLALALSATGLAACATQQSMTQTTEQMLAASGFLEKPANTPRREQHLAALPPYRILSQHVTAAGQDSVGYVYADPQFCHCVFVGGPEAYARFQQLAFQQHLADQQIAAAEMAQDDAFGWGDWGPYPYWGDGVVVVGGRFHHGFHAAAVDRH
jgi:hypothetical protein